MPNDEKDPEKTVPVFQESMGGALIDAARISITAAHALLPKKPAKLVLMQGEQPTPTAHECLEEAMNWLDAARAQTVSEEDLTSVHVVGRMPVDAKCVVCGCTESTPCEGGCSWISANPPICSKCEGKKYDRVPQSGSEPIIQSRR